MIALGLVGLWLLIVVGAWISGWLRHDVAEGNGNARFMLAMPVAILGALIYVLGHAFLFTAECLLAAGQFIVDRVASAIIGD